jgi:glucokinase-like ROK family protein
LTNFVAQILWRKRVVSDSRDGKAGIIKRVENIIQKALEAGEEFKLRRLGIGLGVAGLVDARHSKLVFAPNLRWHDVPFREMWTQRFNMPVFVENEANAAALGEYYFGAARDVQSLIYLSAGVGLGAGIIIDGKLFRGSGGYAGEVGHMTVDPNGELCGCGKRGCWETVVGPRAIARRVREALEGRNNSLIRDMVDNDLSRVDVNIVLQAAKDGDPIAQKALKEIGFQLGVGIGNLVNTFNPEMVVLGGILSLASPFILPAIEESLEKHALPQACETLKVIASAHGADGCVMGGAVLVLDDVFAEPTP